MNQAQLVKTGIALGILYGIYKFAPQQPIKAAALGTAGVIAFKQVPFVQDALA